MIEKNLDMSDCHDTTLELNRGEIRPASAQVSFSQTQNYFFVSEHLGNRSHKRPNTAVISQLAR